MAENRCGNCKHYAPSPDHDRAGFCYSCKYYVTNPDNDDTKIHFIMVDINHQCCGKWEPKE